VDDWLLDRYQGVRLQRHTPVRREVVLQIDQPWEKIWLEMPDAERKAQIAQGVWNGPTPFGFTTVLKDGDVYRLYYTWDRGGVKQALTGYAESRDGVHWWKPELGVVEFRGSKANNLIWTEGQLWDFNPFRDLNPRAKAEERYKTLAGGPPVA